jgi:dihydroflavonol-4-reductase
VAPTVPLGPGDPKVTPPTQMLLDFLGGKLKALVDAAMNVVDARDAAEVHVQAAARGRAGRVYLCGGENLMLSEIVGVAGELVGMAAPKGRVPWWVGRAFASVADTWARRVTGRPPIASVEGARLAKRRMWFDNALTVRELGVRFRPVRETLRDALGDLAERGLAPEGVTVSDD